MKCSIVLLTLTFAVSCIAHQEKGITENQVKDFLCGGSVEADAILKQMRLVTNDITVPATGKGKALKRYKSILCGESRKAKLLIKHITSIGNILITKFIAPPNDDGVRDEDALYEIDKLVRPIEPGPRCEIPEGGDKKLKKCLRLLPHAKYFYKSESNSCIYIRYISDPYDCTYKNGRLFDSKDECIQKCVSTKSAASFF